MYLPLLPLFTGYFSKSSYQTNQTNNQNFLVTFRTPKERFLRFTRNESQRDWNNKVLGQKYQRRVPTIRIFFLEILMHGIKITIFFLFFLLFFFFSFFFFFFLTLIKCTRIDQTKFKKSKDRLNLMLEPKL